VGSVVACRFVGFVRPHCWFAHGLPVHLSPSAGLSGLVLSIVPVDIQLQDTYLRGGAFPLRDGGRALFAAFAGIYFWLPKWTGRMYHETLGKIHFWLTLVFFNMIFFVQHFSASPACRGASRTIP